MKIAYLSPTNVQIRLERGEEMHAVTDLLPAFGEQVTVEIIVAPADPPPASASRLASEEESVNSGDTLPLFVRDDGMTAAPAPAPRERQPRSWSKRIGVVYVTQTMLDIVNLLKDNPQGLSTREMVVASIGQVSEDVTVRQVCSLSGHVNKLVRETGLAIKLPGSLIFKLTEVGMNAPLEVDSKPWLRNKHNKALMRYLREVNTD